MSGRTLAEIFRHWRLWAQNLAARGRLVSAQMPADEDNRPLCLDPGAPLAKDEPAVEAQEAIGG